MSVEPPALLFVLDEGNDRVAWQTVFRRHPLHLTLPPSHQSVLGAGEDRAVCLGNDLLRRRIASWLRIQRKLCFQQRRCGTTRGLPFGSLSKFLRVDPQRDLPGGTCEAGNDFTHLEIANANKLSRFAFARRPNIAVRVLRQSHHHSKRLMVRFGDAPEIAHP